MRIVYHTDFLEISLYLFAQIFSDYFYLKECFENFALKGATALNIAAQIGHRDLVVLLLKFGAEPSLCDNLGRNAADVAQLAGHEHIR